MSDRETQVLQGRTGVLYEFKAGPAVPNGLVIVVDAEQRVVWLGSVRDYDPQAEWTEDCVVNFSPRDFARVKAAAEATGEGIPRT